MGDTQKRAGKGGFLKLALIGATLLAGTAGGAFALANFGIVGAHAADEPHEPQMVRKGEDDPYPAVIEGLRAEAETALIHGEGGDHYRIAYFSFADEFTSNLKGSNALVQTTLAASTRRDGRVIMWLQQHELALRSRILIDLADTAEEELLTPQGKDRVQRRLTASINDVLSKAEGFGGVDQVYFRTLIIQ